MSAAQPASGLPPSWYRSIGTHRRGRHGAITDVAGVKVGHVTLIEGEGARRVGHGPVRTGVTVVVPRADVWSRPLQAGAERIHGAGEVSGLEWIRESGQLTTAIGLTNTHSLGAVRDAMTRIHVRENRWQLFSLPVVGETCDVLLNDMNGQHVRAEHLEQALANAHGGSVEQGSVGGGTGMICHDFKGGIGTASRIVESESWTVGVLVQANHGTRERLSIDGVPVGRLLGADRFPLAPWEAVRGASGNGSIIMIVATDAPLMAPECASVAKRTTFGLARTGGEGDRQSGDFAIAFSTTADQSGRESGLGLPAGHLDNERLSRIYRATIEATEQAIVNALLAAETMTGADGNTVYGLPASELDSLEWGMT